MPRNRMPALGRRGAKISNDMNPHGTCPPSHMAAIGPSRLNRPNGFRNRRTFALTDFLQRTPQLRLQPNARAAMQAHDIPVHQTTFTHRIPHGPITSS